MEYVNWMVQGSACIQHVGDLSEGGQKETVAVEVLRFKCDFFQLDPKFDTKKLSKVVIR